DDAWRCIGEALSAGETTKEKWCEADIHRAAGAIALMSSDASAATAEAHFNRALLFARQYGARTFELRAATSIARLWRAQGDAPRAQDLLASLLGQFTEGFDTPDLIAARALLDTIAS
ncbi:MAG TPA: hypothetical protein VNZ53_07080, partial [Steroidobacteraceae bacterium]|nr:hypothetical protein [Steroidobacteraceae bacterium]